MDKMADEVRSAMVNGIASMYAAERGPKSEADLQAFARWVMALTKSINGVGWRPSTRMAVYAELRSLCLVNGWPLIAAAEVDDGSPMDQQGVC